MPIQICCSLADLPRAEWEALAKAEQPFLGYDFLQSLWCSNSVGAHSGWLPKFLLLREGGELRAALPLWEKHHPLGEYVFDSMFQEAWQNLYHQDYYPKLVSAVPFTPVRVRKCLAYEEAHARLLIRHAQTLCRSGAYSSLHLNFLPETDAHRAEQLGCMRRASIQFHWINRGWQSFEQFLSCLPRTRRKSVRKERASLYRQGFRHRCLSGAELVDEALWDRVYELYVATYARKWGFPYLQRRFFSEIAERMAEKILLVLAQHEGRIIAYALNFLGADAVFGRNWGAEHYVPNLHFETCYYQAIEFAILHKISRVEAGTQGGAHKIVRGYQPVLLSSAHDFAKPSFAHAARQWCREECAVVRAQYQALTARD